MKKIFTLVAVALAAMSANAQDYYAAATYDADKNVVMAEEFQNAVIDTQNGKSVVTVDLTNVTMTAVGSTTPKEIDKDANVSEWSAIEWKTGNQGDIEFPYIQGTGNPYIKFWAEEVITDGQPTGTYRPAYEYYEPDGSNGLPVSGLYYEFKAKAEGTLVLGVWINKGSRKLFVVDKETQKALTPKVDYTLGGYENGVTNEDGTKAYNMDIPTKGTEGDDLYIWGAKGGGQAIWGWLNIPMKADQTYMVFLHNAQIGVSDVEFEAGTSGINDITNNTFDVDAPVYNLAGQRVSKETKGILIQNGKKFINK